jgi:hypothetical protein
MKKHGPPPWGMNRDGIVVIALSYKALFCYCSRMTALKNANRAPSYETKFQRGVTSLRVCRANRETSRHESNIGGTRRHDNAGFGNVPFPATPAS